ncbi:MAG: hypothetical protein WCO84_00900 [bacterium]
MYKRKTKDEWEIQGYYENIYGWERVTTEETRKEAREMLKCYNENEKNVAHRIIKKRVRLESVKNEG